MKNNIKKVLTLLILAFIIAACGSTKDPVSVADALVKNDFSVL